MVNPLVPSNLLRASVILIAALALTGCAQEPVTHPLPTASASTADRSTGPAAATPSAAAATPAADAKAGSALAALAALRIKGRAPRTGYSRQQFGQSWRDLDRNGCDQRNDVLRRDLKHFTLKAGTRGCLVLSGTLLSPYTGHSIAFVRGVATSRDVQVDHVVAMSDAWQKGAQHWDAAKREAFANDFLELRAVDGSSNAAKGDGDAATWLPPRTAFRCGYVARQIAVKKKYGLWVTQAEHDAMARVLSRCPHQGLPRAYPVKLGGGPERTVAPAPTKPEPAPFVGGGATHYENCDAVRAAGRAPIRIGQPGYSRQLDRDGDGIGCE